MKTSVAFDAGNSVGESPFWSDAEQSLYWVDIIGKTVNRWCPESGEHKSWSFDDLVCGIVPVSNGRICVGLQHDLLELDQTTGEVNKLFRMEDDRPDNRLNEMKCDGQGRLWIGTMQNNVNPDGTGKPITKDSGALYCVESSESVVKMEDGLGISNTLAWDTKSASFYFADSTKDMIWKYRFDAETGKIADRVEHFKGSESGAPDGSAIDEEGYLWNARFSAGCVVRIDPEGNIAEKIEVPVTNPTSCCFGGPDNSILYVTSAQFSLTEEQLAANPNEGAVVAIQTDTRGTKTVGWSV